MIDLTKYLHAAKVSLEGAHAAFEKHLANDTTAEAVCGYIEERMREFGFAVGVRFEWRVDPFGTCVSDDCFALLVGARKSLHFTMTLRELPESVAFVHTVKV